MVNSQSSGQANANLWALPATFSEALVKGEEIPDEYKKYYWGFDFEWQLSDLDMLALDYLNTAFEQINALVIKIVDIETYDKYQDGDVSFYKNWADEINSEVKIIIRGRRAFNALTLRESRTFRTKGEEIIEERTKERSGFFSRMIGGKGARQ